MGNLCARRASSADDSSALLQREELPLLFARDGYGLQVIEFCSGQAATTESFDSALRASCWSPDGRRLALLDPSESLVVVDMVEGKDRVRDTLSTEGNLQQVQWSPLGTFIVAQAPSVLGGSDHVEPNVWVWKSPAVAAKAGDRQASCVASFAHPKAGEKGLAVCQWSHDERLCCRLLADGGVEILDGRNLSAEPLCCLALPKGILSCQLASEYFDSCARLAVFMADTRDSLQRVCGPC